MFLQIVILEFLSQSSIRARVMFGMHYNGNYSYGPLLFCFAMDTVE